MGALNWSLIALTALLSFAICSAHRVKPAHIVGGPIEVNSGPRPPIPSEPIASESSPVPVPSGPMPPLPSVPTPSKSSPVPVPSGPTPSKSGPTPPLPSEPTPSKSSPVPAPSGPTPSESGPIRSPASAVPPASESSPVPVPSGPTPVASGPINPVPAMNAGDVNDSEVGTNCCGSGWGCSGCSPPPAPKLNPYYCQPANCGDSPGYGSGSGAGFTIYLGDHFPSSVSNDQH